MAKSMTADTTDIDAVALMASSALQDAENRKKLNGKPGEIPGSKIWRTREPAIAAQLLKMLGLPHKPSAIITIEANYKGQLRLKDEEIGILKGQFGDLRYERDRMRLAYLAAYDLLLTVIADCADPERIDDSIKARLLELKPDEAP